MRWRLGQKAFVPQLALRRGQAFFILGDILCQALTLGGDVRFVFSYKTDTSKFAELRTFEPEKWLVAESQFRNAGEALNYDQIPRRCFDKVRTVNDNGDEVFNWDIEFCSQLRGSLLRQDGADP